MNDIQTESDIKSLVDKFYQKVLSDSVIGFIFTEVVVLSWEQHIPIMNSFWSSLLLGSNTYTGNPMAKHLELNKRMPLTKMHFDRWLQLWENTVNENFVGEKADEAISRAKNIAALMHHKIEQQTR